MDDAFRLHAGCTASEADALDRFDELMVTKIEPELGNGKLTFLCDYPGKPRIAGAAAGGRSVGGGALGTVHRRNRAANAFGELTDAKEQRERFQAALKFRAAAGMHTYPEPVEFFAALERGLPESSGSAMGLDRLTMVMCGATDIADVRA